eukprot:803392-Pleurochrysis_carterae.AAC.1
MRAMRARSARAPGARGACPPGARTRRRAERAVRLSALRAWASHVAHLPKGRAWHACVAASAP